MTFFCLFFFLWGVGWGNPLFVAVSPPMCCVCAIFWVQELLRSRSRQLESIAFHKLLFILVWFFLLSSFIQHFIFCFRFTFRDFYFYFFFFCHFLALLLLIGLLPTSVPPPSHLALSTNWLKPQTRLPANIGQLAIPEDFAYTSQDPKRQLYERSSLSPPDRIADRESGVPITNFVSSPPNRSAPLSNIWQSL